MARKEKWKQDTKETRRLPLKLGWRQLEFGQGSANLSADAYFFIFSIAL